MLVQVRTTWLSSSDHLLQWEGERRWEELSLRDTGEPKRPDDPAREVMGEAGQ